MNLYSDWRASAAVAMVLAVVIGYLVVTSTSLAYALAVLVVVVACAVMFEPRHVLLVAAVLVPLRYIDAYVVTFLPGNMNSADVALVVFAFSAFLRPAVARRRGAMWLPLVALGSAVLVVAVVSMVQSGYYRVGLLRIGRTALVGVCVLGAVRSLAWADAARAARAFVYAVAITSVAGMVYTIVHRAVTPAAESGELLRLWAGVADPNHFAVLAAMAGTIAASWPAEGKRRQWWTTSLIVLTVALVMTLSRGGLVGGVAGIATVGGLVLMSRLRGQAIPAGRGLLVVGGVLALSAGLLSLVTPSTLNLVLARFGALASPESDATGILRIRIWDAAQQLLWQHRALGVGPGAVSLVMMREGYFTRLWEVHNSFLEFAVENGFLGLVPLVLLLLAGTLVAVRQALTFGPGDAVKRLQVFGLTGALIAGIVCSLSLSSVLISAGFALIAMTLAVGCSDTLPGSGEDLE